MTQNMKIGAVGGKEFLCFMTAGFGVFIVNGAEEAAETISRISGEYAVLFVDEKTAEENSEFYERFRTDPTTAIVPIPPKSGASGFGRANIRRFVETAVGTDIFKDR